jgi:hypothetical protein
MHMFEPGHLHITRVALQPTDFSYDIHIRYEVRQAPTQGMAMHFFMDGEINGAAFKDEFELPKDMAYNFASEAFHIAIKHGMPKAADLRSMHGQYDAMFEHIRQLLDAKPGDPVKPEHLE